MQWLYRMQILTQPQQPEKKDIALISFKEGQKEVYFQTLENGQKELILGVEEKGTLNRRKLIFLARRVIASARSYNLKHIAIDIADFAFPKLKLKDMELAELLAVNFEMANYEFTTYKTKPKEGWNFVEDITLFGKLNAQHKRGFEIGQITGQEVNAVRELANTPGGDMTPALLAKKAEEAAKGTKAKITVFDKAKIEELKMGGVLGVAKGSVEEPKFIIASYKGGNASDRPIVLIGKGVTFDTGGINLKPSDSVLDMHMDMSGGAAVTHTVIL